jgi:sigma-B regulation protein RsbU (phosphoserine phosphatase)
MLINRSIAARMVLMVLLGAGCILGGIIGYSYVAVYDLLMDTLKYEAEYTAKAAVNKIEIIGSSVEKVVQGMANNLAMNSLSTNEMYNLLYRTLAENTNIYGAAIALNPDLIKGKKTFCAPYVFRAKGKLIQKDLGAGNYHYEVWDWFNLPEKLKKEVWCEPYFDEGGGNILMVTYCCPMFKNNEFYGVVTSDVSLEWLTELLDKISGDIKGNAWLISANGTFITHQKAFRQQLIMKETLFSAAEVSSDPAVREGGRKIGQRMIRGEEGFEPYTSVLNGKKGWLFFAPVPSTDWSLGVMFLRETIMQYIFELNTASLTLGLVGFALLLLVALAIARSITRPLRQLAGATRTLAHGHLDSPLPKVKGEDEVAQLALSFEHMRGDLKKYIVELQAATVARERMESEMRIAHSIQMDLVPKTFPQRNEFELFGILDPAREVGGDFYDFFLPDDHRIFLFIGDVSGKGMPAALFMAVTRTLLRAICRVDNNPASILKRLNNGLVESNDANMFVTIFCALVDLKSGVCKFSNGGHNPPIVIRKEGEIETLPLTGGAAVGVIPDIEFGEKALTLREKDALFLYTDGVTEAMNKADEMFGEERTVERLRRSHGNAAAHMVKAMREELRTFAAGAEQSDDVTMLAFRLL